MLDKLHSAYSDVVNGRIDDGFSVVDFLVRARTALEIAESDASKFATIKFFGDFVAHAGLEGPPAISFLEQLSRYLSEIGPLEAIDLRLPALRKELGELLLERPFVGSIVSAPRKEFIGWRTFYSLLLEELVDRRIGYGSHIETCANKRLRKALEKIKNQYAESFMHAGHVMAWPLSKQGPPFGFRFYAYRLDPMPNGQGGYVLLGTRPLIAPDGLDWVPWINPPAHLKERVA